MNRLIEKIGDNYKFNADSKKIWQKLFEYEKVGSIEEFKKLKAGGKSDSVYGDNKR